MTVEREPISTFAGIPDLQTDIGGEEGAPITLSFSPDSTVSTATIFAEDHKAEIAGTAGAFPPRLRGAVVSFIGLVDALGDMLASPGSKPSTQSKISRRAFLQLSVIAALNLLMVGCTKPVPTDYQPEDMTLWEWVGAPDLDAFRNILNVKDRDLNKRERYQAAYWGIQLGLEILGISKDEAKKIAENVQGKAYLADLNKTCPGGYIGCEYPDGQAAFYIGVTKNEDESEWQKYLDFIKSTGDSEGQAVFTLGLHEALHVAMVDKMVDVDDKRDLGYFQESVAQESGLQAVDQIQNNPDGSILHQNDVHEKLNEYLIEYLVRIAGLALTENQYNYEGAYPSLEKAAALFEYVFAKQLKFDGGMLILFLEYARESRRKELEWEIGNRILGKHPPPDGKITDVRKRCLGYTLLEFMAAMMRKEIYNQELIDLILTAKIDCLSYMSNEALPFPHYTQYQTP